MTSQQWRHHQKNFLCIFKIKFRAKRISRIFPVLRFNGMAPFCNLFIERPSYNPKTLSTHTDTSNELCCSLSRKMHALWLTLPTHNTSDTYTRPHRQLRVDRQMNNLYSMCGRASGLALVYQSLAVKTLCRGEGARRICIPLPVYCCQQCG